MSKRKQLVALLPLLLMCGSVSAAPTTDTTFKEWIESRDDYGISTPIPPPPDNAEAVFGGSFYIVDPTLPVEFTFVTSQAGYNLVVSVASWDNDGNISFWEEVFVKTGLSVYKGPETYYIEPKFFSYTGPSGAAEIFLRLVADDTTTNNSYVFFSGPASNNPDGTVHVVSFYDYYDGKTLVGFEDMWMGGDMDYDDIVFLVSNVSATPVPEPETWAMLLAGLGMVGVMARRRKNKKLSAPVG
ncbi:MAG: PEPxxWA-CTERM sorting domain-containing protein [Betaproteobacteria bacterium]|nr:PEPxxWA-CTERM sorting domain-containing protein [Betaproteobacteria bacterium]